MSTVSGSRLSTTTKAMLSTVMNRLDAMDDKLKALDPLCKKVTTLEASAEDLGAQQVTLIVVVERVDIMQTALNATSRPDNAFRRKTSSRHKGTGAKRIMMEIKVVTSFPWHTNSSSKSMTAPVILSLGSIGVSATSLITKHPSTNS
jgi:hypothetical protein